jgi:hypothetical protein
VNVSSTIIAKSDQLNADDLVGGPIICRIERVEAGPTDEQPVAVHLEGRRPWYPCKTTRRVLVLCWGDESDKWLGQSVRLFRDPSVKFGGVSVGGIRISGLTGIDRAQTVCLSSSKGKKSEHRIDVLKARDFQPESSPRAELLACVKGMGATQIDIVEFYGEKTNRDVGPVDGWPDKDVTAVLARLRGDGAVVFREWLAARDAAPQWADADARNPPGDELPE